MYEATARAALLCSNALNRSIRAHCGAARRCRQFTLIESHRNSAVTCARYHTRGYFLLHRCSMFAVPAVRRLSLAAATVCAASAMMLAPAPAQARVFIGIGVPFFGFGYYPYPYAYSPPAYYPPVYYAPPQTYTPAPPTRLSSAASCNAGSYVCPLDHPMSAGTSCYCPGNGGP